MNAKHSCGRGLRRTLAGAVTALASIASSCSGGGHGSGQPVDALARMRGMWVAAVSTNEGSIYYVLEVGDGDDSEVHGAVARDDRTPFNEDMAIQWVGTVLSKSDDRCTIRAHEDPWPALSPTFDISWFGGADPTMVWYDFGSPIYLHRQ